MSSAVAAPAEGKIVDSRGTGVWPKEQPGLTAEQGRQREAFVQRWLEVFPRRYQAIDRFGHGYPLLHAAPPGRTLELGAGLGSHLAYEDLDEQEYYALELRAALAKAIGKRAASVQVIVGDCQKALHFEDGFFDRVLAIHLLEHLPNLPGALDETRRVLAPNGRFFAVIPCERGLAYSLARRISARRLFKREFGPNYEWFIRSEHLNVPWEIVMELRKRFRIVHTRFFPLRIPSVALNLAIGLTMEPQASSSKP